MDCKTCAPYFYRFWTIVVARTVSEFFLILDSLEDEEPTEGCVQLLKIRAVIFHLLFVALGVNPLSLSYSHAAQTPEGCARKLVDGTDGLKSYLSMLLENGQISEKDLGLFFKNLQIGKLINPISDQQASTDPVLLIHRDGLEKEYFQNPEIHIDQKELLNWVFETLKIKEKTKKDRKKAQTETKDPFRKIQFHKIPKGKFMMGESKNISVEITRDFLMTETHITQAQWVEVMGENPSKFQDGDQSITIQANGKTVRLQPDHPVENVTWWSVLEFTNRLSVKHGLKPVYDLSKVLPFFKNETKAENGSWAIERGKEKEASELLKILSQSQSFTDTEGYRLAIEAEYEYVLTNLGTSQGKYIFGDSEEELKDYAWLKDNSDQRTHAVAEKKAFLIDENPFYDLHGNVLSWVWDRYQEELENGKDPMGPLFDSDRVLRGGCWGISARGARSAYRDYVIPSYREFSVGLRIVRTLP